MKFKLQIVLDDDEGSTTIEDIIQLERNIDKGYCAGLSLKESKQLLQRLQNILILKQANTYSTSHRACSNCQKQRRIKDYRSIQYKTLFGTVVIPSLRLYQCPCSDHLSRTVSLLKEWLPEHISPELQYIESKWASYMSFNKTSELLLDVLPMNSTHNRVTVRNHLHKVAKKQELDIKEEAFCISGCANDWAKLPKPDKPLTIGIDGGYLRSCKNKRKNFEIIVGKSFSKTKPAKRFGLVQSLDDRPQQRLLHALREQGMQENQQITFLSDGAENLRNLQFIMHPESEHVLDWFHLTMRFTVLNQFAKGLIKSDPKQGVDVKQYLKSAKWYLWHGNVVKGLDKLEECYCICTDEDLKYNNREKLVTHIEEIMTYVKNNRYIIPNYGERYRYGETITTSFVESTVNEVVTKRMVKKQQMQWSQEGAHYLLQTRMAALNDDLGSYFEHWYPGIKINTEMDKQMVDYKKAA